jgi:signal transduction histidine kinase
MARQAIEAGQPYAVIFCDVRMPMFDGVETIEQIRKFDQRAEVVFVTAYSDYSIEAITERVGANVGYFIKPFLTEEIRQLATKLVLEWNTARELEELVLTFSSVRGELKDIKRLFQHLLAQICKWLITDSAALVQIHPTLGLRFQLGVGELSDPATVLQRIKDLNLLQTNETELRQLQDGSILLHIEEYGLALALPGKVRLTPERRYLLQIFAKNAELAIRNAQFQQQLLQNERMATVGKAISFLLHDLRNPIGIAQMYLQIIQSGNQRFGSTQDLLKRIEIQLKKSLDLLGDTRTFVSGQIQVNPEQVKLKPILDHWLDIWLEDFAKRGVSIELDIPDSLEMYIDVPRFERIIWNLTKNAAEALQLVNKKQDKASIVIGAKPQENGIMLWVEDNGPGIPNDIADTLFQPFASSGKADGTGFGLAIVKEITRAHNGHITLEQQTDCTRFCLFFPNKQT